MARVRRDSVKMILLTWLWGGSLQGLLQSSRLTTMTSVTTERGVEVEVRTNSDDRLVVITDIVNSSGNPRPDALTAGESLVSTDLRVELPPDFMQQLAENDDRLQHLGAAGLIAPTLSHLMVWVQICQTGEIFTSVDRLVESLKAMLTSDSNEAIFPSPSVHFIQRDVALLHRTRLPSVLLRMQHDQRLRAADLSAINAATQNGEIVFASSNLIGNGLFLFDTYLGPLLGALTPFVWALAAPRASGTVVCSLSRAVSGTFPQVLEGLDMLPKQGPDSGLSSPHLTARSGPAALTWWIRRLNDFLAVLTDPAVFADGTGEYAPMRHLQTILSVEQLFRRVTAIQQLHTNGEARRVLLFSALDTLEHLTRRDLLRMCDVDHARETVNTLRAGLSNGTALVLMPNADRAISALSEVQDGFFLRRQTGSANVEYTDTLGTQRAISAPDAAARYIKLLRDATHGHGTDNEKGRPLGEALLAHHDGSVPSDLALLAWVYLLDLIVHPDRLRSILQTSRR